MRPRCGAGDHKADLERHRCPETAQDGMSAPSREAASDGPACEAGRDHASPTAVGPGSATGIGKHFDGVIVRISTPVIRRAQCIDHPSPGRGELPCAATGTAIETPFRRGLRVGRLPGRIGDKPNDDAAEAAPPRPDRGLLPFPSSPPGRRRAQIGCAAGRPCRPGHEALAWASPRALRDEPPRRRRQPVKAPGLRPS